MDDRKAPGQPPYGDKDTLHVYQVLGHELLPRNIEGTRVKLKRLVKLAILIEADTGNFARKQWLPATSSIPDASLNFTNRPLTPRD
ncbi:hypothetical protein ACFRNT_31770 [Streptomyces sp. NPDC056697]|uniref:hypothetical protein n=1 Tax=Streptomyces sp. NPDC056697 TaxID=3345915 RepID=UPI0036A5E4C6